MAARERLNAVISLIWTKVRKRPRLSAATLAAFVLVVVPTWPFFPTCDIKPHSSRYKHIYARMSDEYRYVVKAGVDVFMARNGPSGLKAPCASATVN